MVTLPLGVLQAGSVAFDPPLPQFKQEAVEKLGMGTENRVAMLFNKVGSTRCSTMLYHAQYRGQYPTTACC